ncbi:hypothetical protein DNTS_016385 [Danionella cerebrum]|uniref:Uncharacterized protein n=1 Tax=Danionella cerebrum TaxID=2873325 RepID=A0A553PVB9_9TELE|nr:hypothetical protein DNTS_016385 [Danionella translucida]
MKVISPHKTAKMEKSTEVMVFGTSIMKDVWEIRSREFQQRRLMEADRVRKSALQRINQEWLARMTNKIQMPKRLQRKAKLPEEPAVDAHKPKKTHLARPQGFQSSRVQKPVDQAKSTKTNKLAMLRHLNESCPGLMIWSKSWKFSQPLPKQEESPVDWGHSWKFLNLQPKNEGKPWFDIGLDANNNISVSDMFLWEKLSKAIDSERYNQESVMPEWEKAWKFTQKRRESNESEGKSEDRFHNMWRESGAEWQEAWKSTKPLKEGEFRSGDNQFMSEEDNQPELHWDNSWMYFKKFLHMKSMSTSPWRESWRVSKSASEEEMKSAGSHGMELQSDTSKVIMNISRELKLAAHFTENDPKQSEWEKSWTTIKNQSDYKGEVNKSGFGQMEVMVEAQRPEHGKQQTEDGRFSVSSFPKSQRWQEMLLFPVQTDWQDSWKVLRRHHGEEQALRQQPQRRPPPEFSSTSQSLTEWANSWRFTNLTLNQDGDLWQQGWSSNTHPRAFRRVEENENFPRNGPAGNRAWIESWRSTRRQHRSERQGPVGVAPLPIQRDAHERSVGDWEDSWRATPDHRCLLERPSSTEWTDSWRFSSLEDLQPQHMWFELSMEIKRRREFFRAADAFNRSFDPQVFNDQCPMKEWKDSLRVKRKPEGPGVVHLMKDEMEEWNNSWMLTSTGFYRKKGECYENFQLAKSGGQGMSKSVQIESRSEWGQSCKISNPHPPKNTISWVDAKPRAFHARDLIFWSKNQEMICLASGLSKEIKLKYWRDSWRFMKMDSELKHGDESGAPTKSAILRKEKIH